MHVIFLILNFLFMPFSWEFCDVERTSDSHLVARNGEGQILLTVFRHEHVVGVKGLNIIPDSSFINLEEPRINKNLLTDHLKKLPHLIFIMFSSVRYLFLNLQIPPPTL